MLTISVWPRRLKEFLLTHPLYKSPWYQWLHGQKTLLTDGCWRRIAIGFWAMGSTGRVLGVTWRDTI